MSPKISSKILEETIVTLLNNGYPLPFIFSLVQSKLKFHTYNKKSISSVVNKYFIIIVHEISFRVTHSITTKLNKKIQYSLYHSKYPKKNLLVVKRIN